MDSSARLQSARSWLRTYTGKNIGSGYRKHFGVDWVCAFTELEMLGVKIDSGYKSRILKSVEGGLAARRRKKARKAETHYELSDQDDNFAYIAGYTAWGFAYGITWEEMEEQNQWHLVEPDDDANIPDNDELEQLPF